MPRFGPPRGGTDGVTSPRPRAALRLVVADRGREHARDRMPEYWPAELRTQRVRLLRRPARTTRAEREVVADALAACAHPAIALCNPSVGERARRLQAAYEASARDEGQRALLLEIMGHFRAWCEANALGDPFA